MLQNAPARDVSPIAPSEGPTRSEFEEAERVIAQFTKPRQLPGSSIHNWMGPLLPVGYVPRPLHTLNLCWYRSSAVHRDATTGRGTLNANSLYQLDPDYGGKLRVSASSLPQAGPELCSPPRSREAAVVRPSLYRTRSPLQSPRREPAPPAVVHETHTPVVVWAGSPEPGVLEKLGSVAVWMVGAAARVAAVGALVWGAGHVVAGVRAGQARHRRAAAAGLEGHRRPVLQRRPVPRIAQEEGWLLWPHALEVSPRFEQALQRPRVPLCPPPGLDTARG